MNKALATVALALVAGVAHSQQSAPLADFSLGYTRTFGAKDIQLLTYTKAGAAAKQGFTFEYGGVVGHDLTNGVPAFGVYGTLGYRLVLDKLVLLPGVSAYTLWSQADNHAQSSLGLSLTFSFKQ